GFGRSHGDRVVSTRRRRWHSAALGLDLRLERAERSRTAGRRQGSDHRAAAGRRHSADLGRRPPGPRGFHAMSRRGQALIELAVALPALLTLALGSAAMLRLADAKSG